MKRIPFSMVVVMAVALMSNLDCAQSQDPGASSRDSLVQRILSADVQAIRDAGASGDRYYVPYLKRELEDRRRADLALTPMDAARLALAKLGEMQQQQEIWCHVTSATPTVEPLTFELANVGGWYAVQGLRALLAPEVKREVEKAHGAWYAKNHPGDVSYLPDEYHVVTALLKVAPNHPPLASTDRMIVMTNSAHEAIYWREWIDAHKDELSRLEPTGEGVDFSTSACKDGQPVKK